MKPYSLFNSDGQFLIEQFIAVVGWKINPVEAAGQRSA